MEAEVDPEAVQRVQNEEIANAQLGVLNSSRMQSNDAGEGGPEESKDDGGRSRTVEGPPLPGEREKPKPQHDNFIIACAPYPNNKALNVLPRYLTRIKQVDCEDCGVDQEVLKASMIDRNYQSYFEGTQFKIEGDAQNQQCIWLKPEFNCP